MEAGGFGPCNGAVTVGVIRDSEDLDCEIGCKVSSEARGGCLFDGSSLVTIAWLFVLSEGKILSAAALVANAPVGCTVASRSEEVEDGGALVAAGPDVMSFRVSWVADGCKDCSSATAVARLVGHKELLTWGGE